MRLVYADAVKALVYEKVPLKLFMKRTIDGAQRSMGELRSMIDELPAVDAKAVKHGRWIQNGEFDYTYKCSECGEVCPLTPDDESAFQYPYCPNCGAKMDGGEE